MRTELSKKTIVFFDAECLICNRFVLLLLNHNEKLDYYFAPLFGETFKELKVSKMYLDSDSIVLYKQGITLLHAQAIKIIARDLGGFFHLVNWSIKLLPNFFSDYCYKLFASLRFILFEKVESCALISKESQLHLLP